MMQIITHSSDRCVTIRGRLDATNSNELDLVLMDLAGIEQDIVIDMTECTYVSSAGIRIFLKTKKKLLLGQSELLLAAVAPEILRVFEIAGLDNIFRFEGSLEAALSLIEAGRLRKSGVSEIAIGHHKLIYHPEGDDSIKGKYINTRKDASIGELGYALGFGSLSATEPSLSACPDFFISIKKGIAFLPPENSGDPDFRMISSAGIAIFPVCEALSFGSHPTGMLKLASPGLLTFSQVNEAVNGLIGNIFLPDSVTLRIVANFDKNSPSVSIFLANNEALASIINKTGLKMFGELLREDDGKKAYIGITIRLSGLELPQKESSPEEILMHNLTFENLLAVKPFSIGNFLENPVIWLINAGTFLH
jgi:anti-anti-sigma factor